MLPAPSLHVEREGGPGGPTVVLLHGLGGSAGLWGPLVSALRPRWRGPIVSLDLPGHGGSKPITEVTYDGIAEAVAGAVRPPADTIVVGHSLGGVVALALGAHHVFPVSRVLALGVRVRWSEEELATARRRAGRPARHFETEAQARAHALKVAGLPPDLPAHDPRAARLVRSDEAGFRASFDPDASPTGRSERHPGAVVAGLVERSRAPVNLARGDADPSVVLADLRALDPAAVEVPNAGHCPHLDNPHAVADLIVCHADSALTHKETDA